MSWNFSWGCFSVGTQRAVSVSPYTMFFFAFAASTVVDTPNFWTWRLCSVVASTTTTVFYCFLYTNAVSQSPCFEAWWHLGDSRIGVPFSAVWIRPLLCPPAGWVSCAKALSPRHAAQPTRGGRPHRNSGAINLHCIGNRLVSQSVSNKKFAFDWIMLRRSVRR